MTVAEAHVITDQIESSLEERLLTSRLPTRTMRNSTMGTRAMVAEPAVPSQ